MSTEKEREQAFVEEVKKTLQEKGEKLDPEIMIKLSSIRSGVVENRSGRSARLWRMARVPATAFMVGAMCLVLGVFYYHPPSTMQSSLSVIEDLAILVDEDSPDFFAELDFYTWLAEAEDV
jgi:hypothetical protein